MEEKKKNQDWEQRKKNQGGRVDQLRKRRNNKEKTSWKIHYWCFFFFFPPPLKSVIKSWLFCGTSERGNALEGKQKYLMSENARSLHVTVRNTAARSKCYWEHKSFPSPFHRDKQWSRSEQEWYSDCFNIVKSTQNANIPMLLERGRAQGVGGQWLQAEIFVRSPRSTTPFQRDCW